MTKGAWSKKLTNFVFRSKTHPFRWSVPASKVSSEDPPALTLVSIHPLSPTRQPIHGSRRDVGLDLSDCARTRTHRDLSSIKTEWSLPIPDGSSHLSQSYDLEALPSPNGPARSSKTQDTSGPITSLSDAKTEASNQDQILKGKCRLFRHHFAALLRERPNRSLAVLRLTTKPPRMVCLK